MAFASLTIDLNARIANIERDMGRAAHVAETQAKRMEGAFAKAGMAMSTIGGALAGAGLISFAKSSLDAADALNDMSIRTGVTVKDLASLQLVAEQSGTSLEGIGVGLGKLNKSASEAAGGNDKLATALTSLGVTAATPLERFYQLADAVKGMDDPTARAADLSAVLGKSYLDLIPTLQQGSEGLRASALASATFADSMARLAPDADKFNDQLAQIKINAAGAAGSILANMIPSLNEYIAVMKEVVKNGSLLDKIRFFGLGNASDEVVGKVRKAADEAAKAAASVRKAGGGSNEAQLDCIASGGTWNGKTCTPKKTPRTGKATTTASAKLDTIDPFGKERTAAELAARNEIIKRANEEAADEFRLFSGPAFDAETRALEEYKSRLESLVSNTTLAQTEKLQSDIDFLNTAFFEGTLGAQQYEEAIAQMTGKSAEEIKKTTSLAEELGLTFSSAFEEAAIGGGKFSDVLKGIEKDIARIIVRKSVTEPIGNAVSSIFGKIDFSKLFGFASGGSFTVGGSGGTDSQLVAFRATPGEDVSIRTPGQQASAGGGVTIVQNISVDSRSDRASIMQVMIQAKDLAKAEIYNSMQRGGSFARATGRA